MLKDLVETLVGLGRTTGTAQILKPAGDHSRKIETLYPDGSKEITTCLRPARVQAVTTLDSFITALQMLDQGADKTSGCVVSCRLGQIVARPFELSDDDQPQDSILWKFPKHPFVEWLAEVGKSVKKSAGDLRTLLRVGLGEVFLDPADLVQKLMLVNFEENSELTDEDTDNMRRIGKTITAKVRGIDAVPDKFRVTFPPSPFFPDLSPATVEIGLRAVPEESLFLLTPKAGDLAIVIAAAEDEIVSTVASRLDRAVIDVAAVLAGWRD